MVNHTEHTQVCYKTFLKYLLMVILMFKMICCCYFLLFLICFTHSTMALMEDPFLPLVLTQPVFTEQISWQEPDSESLSESQSSSCDSQMAKLGGQRGSSNSPQHLSVKLGTPCYPCYRTLCSLKSLVSGEDYTSSWERN